MTETLQTGTQAAQGADTIELLGLVAQLEMVAFARLAADSALAPTLEQRLRLSRFAATSVANRDRVLARIAELGADPAAVIGGFEHVLDDFDARTAPSTWWERLLTSYVGYGVADDFCRLAAGALDETSRALVLEVLDDVGHAELAVEELDVARADDEVLVSRLALWGRRLVGEALGVVQTLVGTRPALARLVGAAYGLPEGEGAARLFGELTAQHTRRMTRLGLTA
jgi:hypothetical protein